MGETKIVAFICADDGDVVACVKGADIKTLKECSACRVNHSRSPCRVNMNLNDVVFHETEILSVRSQIEKILRGSGR